MSWRLPSAWGGSAIARPASRGAPCSGWQERFASRRWTRLVALAALLAVTAGQARADDPVRLAFSELYKSIGVLGLQFSDKVTGLRGKAVTMRGFMAPPLKPEAGFFVMTREPVSLCPFCQTDADWPSDIVVVYLRHGTSLTRNTDPIEVTGALEVGSATDGKTGFVSLLRLVDARLRRL